ncbi:MAG: DUF1761 domain-containing protein [Bacillota bacterium]|jgi:hypothetical protein|uniref:DUF1761 family protein n=1 Tax=Bacillus sp. RO2 TaxID=2723913 RepID=UPI00145DFFD9|nr:DUF1761 family protein [Bacillus sp. RO2]MEA3321391.1 DUF1761 domain-containing protein [Bacillota bacterium]NMH72092.1 DUF1761 domain-containing protein [Bacillus sp. RO2]
MMDWSELNVVAILIGALLYAFYGGIYYTIMLGKKKDPQFKQTEGPLKYVVSIIIAFASSIIVASLVQAAGAEGILSGLIVGLLIGIIITLVYLKNTLFGLITKKAFYIAVGDHLIIFTLLGMVHGVLNGM